jgi:hypothetical protein
VSIDPDWSTQAMTGLDVSAMTASESIVNASQDSLGAHSTVRDDNSQSVRMPQDVVELGKGGVYDSEGYSERERNVVAPTDYATGGLHTAASGGADSAQEQLAGITGARQLDQGYASSLATSAFREQQYVGHIVDHLA